MRLKARQELTSSIRTRYQQASYQGKQKILDEYVAVTGYHLKAAIRILRAKPSAQKPRVGKVKYDAAVKGVVEQVWQIANRVKFAQRYVNSYRKLNHRPLCSDGTQACASEY